MNTSDIAAGRPLEPDDAIKQIAYLRDLLESTRLRLATAWPVFVMWGVIWVLGYLALYRFEARGPAWLGWLDWLGWMWLVFVVMGTVGQLIWAARFRRRTVRPTTTLERQLFRMELALFVGAVFMPFASSGGSVYLALGTYLPFLIGLGYVQAGIFLGRALVIIGAWIALAATAAAAMPDDIRWLWLAAAGGGGLIFTGLLLRRQLRRS